MKPSRTSPLAVSPSSAIGTPEAMSENFRWAEVLGVGTLSAGLLLLPKIWFDLGLIDDAYIFLRYARNAASGLGLVFNIGERVEGFSSPLWTLLLIPLVWTVSDPSRWLSWISWLTAGILLTAMAGHAHRRREKTWWIAPIWMALLSPTGAWAFSGMDMALFTLLGFLSAMLFLSDAHRGNALRRSGLLLGATVVCRMEGVLWIVGALTILATCRRSWKDKFASAAGLICGASIPVAALLLWRQSYYGDWLPHTYHAKIGGEFWTVWRRGALYLAKASMAHAVLLGAAILNWSRKISWSEEARSSALLVSVYAMGIVFTGGDHFAQYRFFLPVVPLLCRAAAQSAEPLFQDGSGATEQEKRKNFPFRPLLGIAIVLISLPGPILMNRGDYRFLHHLYEVRMTETWASVGRFAGEKIPGKGVIAATTIGAIGYYSNRPLIDLLGLTDKHIARHGSVGGGVAGHERSDPQYVLDRKPEAAFLGPYLTRFLTAAPRELRSVKLKYPAERELATHPEFQKHYRLRHAVWEDRYVIYFERIPEE